MTCRTFLEERLAFYSQEHSDKLKQKWLLEEFLSWLKHMVTLKLYDECFRSITILITNTSAQLFKMLRAMAQGSNSIVKTMKAFNINGYRFHTQALDETKKKTPPQNYGVMVEADGKLYSRKITNIIELDHFSKSKVVLFRRDWVDVN